MPTHGSLIKAGKVRNQTPKLQPLHKKKTFPRKNNHKKWVKKQKQLKREQRQNLNRRNTLR